ncbi:MAG: AAA family ATPase [Patescibacteria group bacterium]|jgi:chromosome segregation protein
MYLEKLEIQGFKTFVRKTTLTFPQPKTGERRGVAGIVGPNGSGKSNFADALRWVMGEQSLKSLRGKKSEDVIFSGTEKLPRVGMAEVSLFLNNEDRQAPIDFSEVVITRRLYRSGESDYLINNKKVRLQDVTLLLAEASCGQKTYSIIGQGMVDAILMATPLERKAYFDEASGTRPLQLKREEAEHKLRQTEDNLRQGDVLIEEIAPRLRSLTRQVRRLERREEVEKELIELRHHFYGSALFQSQQAMRRSEAELNAAAALRETATKTLQTLEEQFGTLERTVGDGEGYQRLTAEYQRIWDARAAVSENILRLKSQLAASSAAVNQAVSVPALTEVYHALERTVGALLDAVEGQKQLDSVAIQAHSNSLREHLVVFRGHLFGATEDDTENTTFTAELEQFENEATHLAKSLDAAQQQMQQFHEKEREKNKTIFDLERSVRTAREHVSGCVEKEHEHQITLARLSATREALNREIAEELNGATPRPETTLFSEPEQSEMRHRMEGLKRRLAEIGTIDEETAKEYEETKTRFEFLTGEAEDLRKATHDLRRVVRELDETIARQFTESFQRISKDFEKFFTVLFNGGTAKLVAVAVDDPGVSDEGGMDSTGFEASRERTGIDIQVTPPGKRLKHISMLSGGERALTSLALICAIISSNPSPFVVLDEVDAALDEANSVRFAEIIDQLSHRTQFVVITHNRASMHQANILYGITMSDDGASKVLSLKLEDIERTLPETA